MRREGCRDVEGREVQGIMYIVESGDGSRSEISQ